MRRTRQARAEPGESGRTGVAEPVRIAEALIFAAREPLEEATIAAALPDGTDVRSVLSALQSDYSGRGIALVRRDGRWAFRTAADLAPVLRPQAGEPRRLSRAALETLAIIAYHQPVTRAEIEDIRGVSISRGTLDVLLETGWVRLRGRRRAPGRPVTYGTTPAFLDQFSLESLSDLPGLDELKGAGLLDGRLPPGFAITPPDDASALAPDEDPLDPADLSMAFPAPEPDDDAA